MTLSTTNGALLPGCTYSPSAESISSSRRKYHAKRRNIDSQTPDAAHHCNETNGAQFLHQKIVIFFLRRGWKPWNALSPENYIKAPREGKKIQHTPHHTNSRDTNLHKGPYKTLNSKEKPLDPLILPSAAALPDPPESGKSCNAKESPAK